jgi:hypothetical protein
MNIQKRIVLTVELLFTAYLTCGERKIVICPIPREPRAHSGACPI